MRMVRRFVDLGLALAVVLGDLGHLDGQFGLVVAGCKAEHFQGTPLALGRGEWLGLGFAGQVDTAVQPGLYPYLSRVAAVGVLESVGLGRPELVVRPEDASALKLNVRRAREAAGGLGHGLPLAAGVVRFGELLPDQGGPVAQRSPGLRGVLVKRCLLRAVLACGSGGLVGVAGGLDAAELLLLAGGPELFGDVLGRPCGLGLVGAPAGEDSASTRPRQSRSARHLHRRRSRRRCRPVRTDWPAAITAGPPTAIVNRLMHAIPSPPGLCRCGAERDDLIAACTSADTRGGRDCVRPAAGYG
jgi:hypothetical protein